MSELFTIITKINKNYANNLIFLNSVGLVKVVQTNDNGCRSIAGRFAWKMAEDLLTIADMTFADNDGIWLIDGRLASDWVSLVALVDETISAGADLAINGFGTDGTVDPASPLDGLVRLSGSMFSLLRDDPRSFAALRVDGFRSGLETIHKGLTVLDWKMESRFQRFVARQGRGGIGIRYPVDDEELHSRICRKQKELQDGLGSMILQYSGERRFGWYVNDVKRWCHWFGRAEPTKVLELNASDGIATNAMLDLLFPHPESEVHSIHATNSLDPDEMRETLEAYHSNSRVRDRSAKVASYVGNAAEALAWMIAEDNYWESFDFIHVTPPLEPFHALGEAFQAWHLLKPGGVIVFDGVVAKVGDRNPSMTALETFHRQAIRQVDTLLTGDRIALRKRPAAVVPGDQVPVSPLV